MIDVERYREREIPRETERHRKAVRDGGHKGYRIRMRE